MSKVVKVFISQPMRDKTEEEIKQERERAIKNIETLIVDDAEVEIIDSILDVNSIPQDYNVSLYCLGESIKLLSQADILYMCKGWSEARGCCIERICAQEYGIKIFTE